MQMYVAWCLDYEYALWLLQEVARSPARHWAPPTAAAGGTWAPAKPSNFWEPAVAYPWPTRDLSVTYPWAGELEDFLVPGVSGAGPPPSVVGGASAGVWVVGILSSLVPPAAAVRAQILDAQPTPRPL